MLNNDVPLGQAGTGAAYVLGPSRAAAGFVDELDKLRQYEAQNRLIQQRAKQQQAAQLAAAMKQNQVDISGGYMWQPEIAKMAQSVVDKGNSLFQRGIDPYNYNHSDAKISAEVNGYLRDLQVAQQAADYRKSIQPQLSTLYGKINENTDPEFVNELNTFMNMALSDIMGKNVQLPTYQNRFNYGDFLGKLKGASIKTAETKGNIRTEKLVPNEQQNRAIVIGAIQNDPQAMRAWQKAIGIPLDQVATTDNYQDELAFNTDYYKNDPNALKELVDAGITDFGDKFKSYVAQQTQQGIDAKKRGDAFIQQGVNKLNNDINRQYETNPDYRVRDQQIQDENLRMARDRQAMARARFADWQKNPNGKEEQSRYFDVLSDNLRTGVDGTAEQIGELFSGNPDYNRGIQIVENTPSTLRIRIPAKYKNKKEGPSTDADGNKIPNSDREKVQAEKTYTLPKNDANRFKIVLSSIYKQATGSTIQPFTNKQAQGMSVKLSEGSLDDL